MPAQTAKTPGNGSGTLSYTLASDSFDIESVYVSVDATTATGPVTAELTVRDQSGVVIARKKQGATIPAGSAGSATWALRLDDEAVATVSGYATVQDEGVALPQETILDFVGAGVTASDDAANSRTLVTIPGVTAAGGGYGDLVASIGSLVSYWKMNAASGNQPDTSGNLSGAKDLQLQSGTTHGTYETTAPGPVLAVDTSAAGWRSNYNQSAASVSLASADYFAATDAGHRWAFLNVAAFSVSLWLKPTSGWSLPTSTSPVPLIGTQQGPTPNSGWGLSLYPPGSGFAGTGQVLAPFRGNGSSAGDQLIPVSSVPSDVWTHVAFTYDGTTMRLYQNGVLVGQLASSKNLPNLAGINVAAGNFWGTVSGFLYGQLSEIAVFSAALTQAQISQLAAGSVNPQQYATASVTGAYTATQYDFLILASGTFTVTLPTSASVGAGRQYVVKNTGVGTITVSAAGTEKIDGAGAPGTVTLGTSKQARAVICDGSGWQIVSGYL